MYLFEKPSGRGALNPRQATRAESERRRRPVAVQSQQTPPDHDAHRSSPIAPLPRHLELSHCGAPSARSLRRQPHSGSRTRRRPFELGPAAHDRIRCRTASATTSAGDRSSSSAWCAPCVSLFSRAPLSCAWPVGCPYHRRRSASLARPRPISAIPFCPIPSTPSSASTCAALLLQPQPRRRLPACPPARALLPSPGLALQLRACARSTPSLSSAPACPPRAMEGFDTLTMSYLSAPMSLQPVPGPDQRMAMPMVPMDQYDQRSTYDAETFAGSEDAFSSYHMHQPPPQMKRFNSTFDDPYSDVQSAYEQSVHPHDQNGIPESPSIDSNNKLLSFSLPSVQYTILSYTMQRVSLSMAAQLHGMFFLAESPWQTAGDVAAPPTELTCYRRNLFQITGTITLPRSLQFLMTDQGDQIPILGQELTITATESLEGNPVKIISVPWKTPATSNAPVEDKTEKEPSTYPLDLSTGQDMDSEYVSFPISWKRLQFRIATANNGRRKELQQHFVVRLKVVATLATGAKVPICEIHSGAIIVRGRSPRNFQSRKDMPISGGTSSARKAQLPPQPSRTPTGDGVQNSQNHTPTQAAQNIKQQPQQQMDRLQMPFEFNANDIPVSPDFIDWKIPPPGAMTAIPPDPPSSQIPHATPYAQSTPEISRSVPPPQRTSIAPVTLSLTDDEPKKVASPNEQGRKRATPVRPPSFSIGMINSPDESADLLYEYFPLGLDDWMPPVDAVYRPHVVHHTNLPQDPKALAVKNRSKRYFSDAW